MTHALFGLGYFALLFWPRGVPLVAVAVARLIARVVRGGRKGSGR